MRDPMPAFAGAGNEPGSDRSGDVRVLAEGLFHPEGPAPLGDGSFVFVETFREQVSRWTPGQPVVRYCHTGGGPNACCTGTDGIYITLIGGKIGGFTPVKPAVSSIARIRPDGQLQTVLTQIDGRSLSAPNDLCFGRSGNLLFTDPGAFNREHPEEGFVYSIRPDGTVDFVQSVGPTFPNGLVALADGSVVWVESYTRQVRRRAMDGAVSRIATLPEGHVPDGLKLSVDGRLFIASIGSGGIDVVPLSGGEPAFIHTGGRPLNCLFWNAGLLVADDGERPADGSPAGPSGRLLLVAAGVAGAPIYRGAVALPGSENRMRDAVGGT